MLAVKILVGLIAISFILVEGLAFVNRVKEDVK